MYEVAQKELCSRVCEAPTTCRGMKFPLCDTKCLAVVFLADHGNTAFRAGITLVADDKSGPGDFKKVAHLRAKESVLMLQNTFLNDLVVGIEQLQGSVAVIVEREDQATALFGPRDAFVGELFSNVKGYIPKEESKRNREVMKSNPIVRRTQEEVHNKTRRNFSKKSVANKKQKIEQKVIVKDERRRQCE